VLFQNSIKLPTKQKGLVLVIFVIIIVLAFISYIVGDLSLSDIKTQRDLETTQALKKAKQALLAYAMNYPDTGAGNLTQGPGNFPCPDDGIDGADGYDGLSDPIAPPVVVPGCNSIGNGTMGRLPWATLQIEELRDGAGELLWYAVSSNFVNAADRMVNTASVGGITLRNMDGTIRFNGVGLDGVVAVIIAPGETLRRDDTLVQSRITAAELDDPRNYLDIAFGEDNAEFQNNGLDGFIVGEVFDVFNNVIVNDQITVITYNDIMELVHARAANDIGNVIEQYFLKCGAYPEAAAFDHVAANYDSVPLLKAGALPTGVAQPFPWNIDSPPGCNLTGVKFPDWVLGEQWHFYTYYEYAYTNPPVFPRPPIAPLPPGTLCVVGTCLTVTGMPAPNNKEVIIMFSGRKLNEDLTLVPPLNAQVRPSANLNDYFEVENSNGDLIFDLTPYDTEVPEDYIRVVSP